MDYITVQEAAKEWGISARQALSLCERGIIWGATRFGMLWAIPHVTEYPKGSKVNNAMRRGSVQSSQFRDYNREFYREIVKSFPYPMHIAAADGTLLEANDAFLNFFKVSSNDKISGKFNVLLDIGLEKWGIRDYVLRAFRGEVVQVYDIKVPVQDLVQRFSNEELATESIYQNITSFPVYDRDRNLVCVVTVFITSRMYVDQGVIARGKDYMDTHWQDKFDIDKIANHVYMSKYHFTRQFKKHTGMTPYVYYQEVKMTKLKEKLCDKSISINQAFGECGMDYSGYFSKLFKMKFGMTPSQYRFSKNS
jgi:AraC-like DNA-binding protein